MKIKYKTVLLGALVVFSTSALAHPVKLDARKAKKHATHANKSAKKTKALLGPAANNKIDSNAYNFKSMVNSSVNPQTGQLSTSITLGRLNAHQLAPNFTLTANYSQGSQSNSFNLGEGWGLNLTSYDKTDGTLHTANGASYRKGTLPKGGCLYSLPKGITLPGICTPENFQYHELKDLVVQVYRNAGIFTGVQVIYPDGHREILDINGRLTNIIYPRGYAVTLTYSGATTLHLPTNITDNFGNTITFTSTGMNPVITSKIDGKTHVVSIQGGGSGIGNLNSVTEGPYTTKFGYQQGQPQTNLLSTVTYPSGAKDVITYNNNQGAAGGLPFKEGAQQETLPVVTKMETDPSTPNEKPVVITYEYGKEGAPVSNNYTGYPTYAVSDTQDVLFQNSGQFLYQTTENVSLGHYDGNTTVERITRTYERHHYLMEQKIQRYNTGSKTGSVIKDVLYSYCPNSAPGPLNQGTQLYPGQLCITGTAGSLPVTSGLPAAVKTISTDLAGHTHTSEVLSQYDNSGNVTEKINCSDADVSAGTCMLGKTTKSVIDNTQYAAPLVAGGITNTVASKSIVTPFDGTRSITNGLQTLTGLDGLTYQEPATVTTNFQAPGKNDATALETTTNTWQNGYISNAVLAFAKNSPLANYGESHLKSFATSYTHSTNTANHTYTVTEHVGTLSSSKTYDSASGLLVSETDNAGHVTQHQYDSLGRVTSVTDFSDTSDPLKTTYQYALPSGGIESMTETKPKSTSQSAPYEVKTVFDSLGKPIAHYDNMNSTGGPTGNGPTTELSSSILDPLGKVVVQGEGNIIPPKGGDLTKASYYFYNTAGEKMATLYPNGTFSVTVNNAPNNLQFNYLAGIPKGKSSWVFNGFKVIQKAPRKSAAFTDNAKNPSNIVLNTYILPADPAAKNAQAQPVYPGSPEDPSTPQGRITQLESQIGGVLTQLAGEKNNAQQGYAMQSESLVNFYAHLAGFLATAITKTQYYSSSDAVYDGFAHEISTKDVNGHTTTMQYDGLGRQVLITNPAGQVTHIHYNIINKPICLALGATASATDACVAALNPS